jgi:hypothetical protein
MKKYFYLAFIMVPNIIYLIIMLFILTFISLFSPQKFSLAMHGIKVSSEDDYAWRHDSLYD